MTSSGSSTVIPGNLVRSAPQIVSVTVPSDRADHEIQMELERKDGLITALNITCNCGQQIRLVCDY